jgi:O-acetyl-ADP-ribose deacetylase (regulator of RNase III)
MRRYQSYNIGKSQLHIILGNLKEATTDVIVTSDDTQLSMGGGTSKAILEAAGEVLRTEARQRTPVSLGGVVSTSSGNLKKQGVSYIFHAATIPSAKERDVADQNAVIRRATRQALAQLSGMGLRSIAMPALGTGFAKFDARTVALAMTEEIKQALLQSPDPLEVQLWLLFSPKRDLEAVQFLSAFTTSAGLSQQVVPTHGVVIVHGIRTAAGWRDRIGNEIERADPHLTPIPIGYGFFDVVRFILPGPWRTEAAETVWAKMKSVFDNPNLDRVSIVAHSFGTWIVGYLLTHKEVRFHRVLLCGAILDTRYNWDKVMSKISGPVFPGAPTVRIINDCGTSDIWPMLARSATWGYGMSGRWGFQHALVRDRFHPVAHSGFFEEGFATAYWVPALTRDHIQPAPNTRIEPPHWLAVLSVVKLPYLLLLVALIGSVAWLWRR